MQESIGSRANEIGTVDFHISLTSAATHHCLLSVCLLIINCLLLTAYCLYTPFLLTIQFYNVIRFLNSQLSGFADVNASFCGLLKIDEG